jgi:hypothetical protein
MTRLTSYRLIGTVALCVGAIALGSALHVPAVAAEQYQRYFAAIATGSCASKSACLQETNTSSGPAVKGISTSGSGSVGQTKFKSTSVSNGKAGVIGQDISTSGAFDSGVLGTSTSGTGVQGTSVSGVGVVAKSINQSALFAESGADGIQSVSLNNDGTNSSTQNNSSVNSGRSGIWGHDDSTDGGSLNNGVTGSSTNGTGVFGVSTNWVGVEASGGTFDLNTKVTRPALSVSANTIGGLDLIDVFDGCISSNPCSSANYVARIDGFGDMWLSGQIFTSGSCSTGCATQPGVPGRRVVSYAPREAQPTMEDVGEAQLIGGHAYVRLESKYASVIDRGGSYFVFITPEGDCDQLYVTAKTAIGFAVREARNGHSSVPFQYRIVARPYGDASPRLPDLQMRAASRTGRDRRNQR